MNRLTMVVIALVMTCSVTAFAAEITGVLVDKACYTQDKANTANAHKGMGDACAQACAKKGGTVALVTDKGEVYDVMTMGALAAENNAKLVPHMAHTVTLTGDVVKSADKKTLMIHATELKMISK
jgi:hypothetical protein